MGARNKKGGELIKLIKEDSAGLDPTVRNPTGFLMQLEGLEKHGESAVFFVHQAARWLEHNELGDAFVQAVWNCRDQCKAENQTVFLLSPAFKLPAEIAGDVLLIDEPLPEKDELKEIVERNIDEFKAIHKGKGVGEDVVEKAVEAVQGLPTFQADQAVALNCGKEGIDVQSVWDEKKNKIDHTNGLKCFRDSLKFDDIGGVENVKQFLTQIMHGKDRPNAVVFLDEIEKMLSGGDDSSGVSQDQLGTLLTYMQDQNAIGTIFLGPPGSAKSMVAKAAGSEAGIPTIQLDLGGVKGQYVGQSEKNLRNALKVVTSVSNKRALFIATCNSIGSLPPELRRRFKLGTFFFDLPNQEEREVIWKMYHEKYGLVSAKNVDDEGWTGAEIQQCCEVAWRLGCSTADSAKFVVPVARAAASQIQALRENADGKYTSASYPGPYKMESGEEIRGKKQRRVSN